jgi:hypothetical protein
VLQAGQLKLTWMQNNTWINPQQKKQRIFKKIGTVFKNIQNV